MSAVELLTGLVLAAAAVIGLMWHTIHRERKLRRDVSQEASLYRAEASARAHTNRRLRSQLLGEMVKTRIAQSRQIAAAKYTREMERQRDHALAQAADMQRRLAQATWPVGGDAA